MKTKLDHIGVAVRSLEEAVAAYGLFGLELRQTHVNQERGVKVGFLPVGGGAFPGGDGPQIEFIESLGPETNIAKFIERRGEGLHHICLEVDDIRAALAELVAQGIEPIDREPRRGAEGMVAFLQPSAGKGVLIELVQKDK